MISNLWGNQLSKALTAMLKIHDGQTDKAGMPYILHPLRVMNAVNGMEEKIVALLHDAVEDGYSTHEGMEYTLINVHGIKKEYVAQVSILTRREHETYDGYISRIINSGSMVAMRVKLADLNDNMSAERLALLTPDRMGGLQERYSKARERISVALRGHDNVTLS